MSRKFNVKAVLFDFDGVIISTDECHYNSWRIIADELGVYFDQKINDSLRGLSREESLNIILKSGNICLSSEKRKTILEKKNNIYLTMVSSLDKEQIVNQVSSVMDCLHSKNIKVAIASASKNARRILKDFGIDIFMDAIVDGNDITKSKPDPEVFLSACKAIDVNPSDCLVIEDSLDALKEAENMNMKCLYLSKWKDGRKYSMISHFSEVVKLVK
jgi:beta-phosphoglucomutase